MKNKKAQLQFILPAIMVIAGLFGGGFFISKA
jgi:hypothetical protein